MKVQEVKAVIGSNFGDEGKGLLTDYFVRAAKEQGLSPVVIRFNGGPQAGHTVEWADGSRFVFGHLGSGTFRGAPTYLSRFFLSNPMLFLEEFERYTDEYPLKPRPVVYVDPLGLVTTPYDMLLNQLAEEERAGARHGSCGRGINETIRRSEDYAGVYRIVVADLLNPDELAEKLERIQEEYVPARIKELGIKGENSNKYGILVNGGIAQRFLSEIKDFLNLVVVTEPDVLATFTSWVFEGAQGLLLDKDNVKYFPHLTNSNTGVKNVSTLVKEFDVDPSVVEVVYVTRWFITRHGAGPFPQEYKDFRTHYPHIHDRTNEPNEYQGSLRYGLLDLVTWGTEVDSDFVFALEGMRKSVAVTWLDQMHGKDIPATPDQYYGSESPGETEARVYTHPDFVASGSYSTYPPFYLPRVIAGYLDGGVPYHNLYRGESRYAAGIVVDPRPVLEA